MKIIVTVEAQFVVEVDTYNMKHAARAITANWDSVYKQQAKWRRGIAPQLQGGQILGIEPAPIEEQE